MFERITPEEAGISSLRVAEYIEKLERRGFAMHSVLMAKGDKLFCEAYWQPYHKDECHRMYSQTKSYTAIGIGLLIDDGKLSLDDKVAQYFTDVTERDLPPNLAELTVRNLLMMQTAGCGHNWFSSSDEDRAHLYMNAASANRRPGTVWEYDSAGSQLLAQLVDRLAGKPLFDFLYERIFQYLGTFKTAEILKTRNGASWGDSALVCTPRDMVSFARFLMDGGRVNGKQLLSEAFIKEATSPLADNNITGFRRENSYGYGYQIWCWEQGFGFNGMGCQFTVAVPESDLIFVCTADNQGHTAGSDVIIGSFFDDIVYKASPTPLAPDPKAAAALDALVSGLTLATAYGAANSPLITDINGRVYRAEENRTGIKWFSFHFLDDGTGELHYENAQGEKVLPFGLGKNVITQFPQYGYSDGYGGLRTDNGFTYRCASSVAFGREHLLHLRVQIIDRYLGNMFASFGFRGNDVTVRMTKNAEDFLNEYYGFFTATAEQ